MTKYSWTDVDNLEDAIASGRFSAEALAAIPGLSTFSLSARRDAALAELLATSGGGLMAPAPSGGDDTALLQGLINAANGNPLQLAAGTYQISELTNVPGKALILRGAGIQNGGGTVLQCTAAANIGITIGGTANGSFHLLEDFILSDTGTNLGGIALGTSAFTATFTKMRRVRVLNFTATNAYGISLNTVQECDLEDCYLVGNYDNVYRPNSGTLTSTLIHGAGTLIGNALRHGLRIDGPCFDLHVAHGVVFESNAQGAIYAVGQKVFLTLDTVYFEDNAASSGDTIVVSGAGSGADASTVSLCNSKFVGKGRAAARHLNLDYTINGTVVKHNSGLLATGTPSADLVTTANTVAHFEDNAENADAVPIYAALLGSVTWEESSLQGVRTTAGREISLAASATALIEHSHAGSDATYGWLRLQDEASTGDQLLYRRVAGVDTLVLRYRRTDGAVLFTANALIGGALGVGNSTSGSSLGSVTKKIEVFDAAGASLGFLPVYDAIT